MAARIMGASRVAPGLFEGSPDDVEITDGVISDFDDDRCLTKLNPISGWPRGMEQTRPPVSHIFRMAAAVVKSWTPTDLPSAGSYAHLCRVYSAVDLDLDAFVGGHVLLAGPSDGDLASGEAMLPLLGSLGDVEGPPALPTDDLSVEERAMPSTDVVGDAENTEVGAPSTTLLVEAIDQLRAWLPIQQQDLARYVGISPSTIMSWKREAPRFPRHRSIPALLALRAAVVAARAEVGQEAAIGLIWARGEKAGAPTVRPAELAETLLAAATEASNTAWLEDDGYVPGQSVVPSAEDLLEGETMLAEGLASGAPAIPGSAAHDREDRADLDRVDRGREPGASPA